MSSTLLLRLAGPLQAWGTDSKFEIRRTDHEPSKSGVIGMLAAALGRRRNDSLEDLNKLRFAVRVDQEGKIIKDFHMVNSEQSYLTMRYYISDAVFVVGLESDDDEFLKMIEKSLKSPVFPLYLGRKSCPPSLPLILGIQNEGLLDSLKQVPWKASEWKQKEVSSSNTKTKLRIISDVFPDEISTVVRQDVAISINPEKRQHTWRKVAEHISEISIEDKSDSTTHDPMKDL